MLKLLARKPKPTVEKAVRDFPGHTLHPTANRVGVVSWSSLFPSAHEAVANFGKLPEERPTGPGYIGDPTDENVWQRGHFLDRASTPFTPHDPAWMTAVIPNASGPRGVPHMLRKPEGRPVLSDVSVRQLGLDRILQPDGTLPVTRGAARRERARSRHGSPTDPWTAPRPSPSLE